MVSGELVGMGMFSPFRFPKSPAPKALRNQPFPRGCTGDESGVGDSEGNDVKLFVSAAGEEARPKEALELRFNGLTRTVLLFLLIDAVEFCDEVRTRSTALGVSGAVIFSGMADQHAHPRK